MGGFSDVITRCSSIAVSERDDATDWRRIAQRHGVVRGGVTFHDIRWTRHGDRDRIFRTQIGFITDGGVDERIIEVQCFEDRIAVTIHNTRYADTEHFIAFRVNIVHCIDGKRGGYAIRPNNRLGGFSDVVTGCRGVAISKRDDATHWRWIAQRHGVVCGGVTFYDIRWTRHGDRNGIFWTRLRFIADGGVDKGIV